MSEDCFAVFMDESGLGSKRKGKANYWVSVGVMAGINDHYSITQDIHDLKKKSMRLYNKEMKGTDLSANHLNAGITKETVAKDLAEIIKNHGLRIVVTATNMSPKLESLTIFTPSNEKRGLQAKDVARELLLERISMMAESSHDIGKTQLMIWDLSDTNELMDFSKIAETYQNPHSQKKLNTTIIPHILGGLSHEWAELQIADLVSNYAINYIARNEEDADAEKCKAFKQYLYPMLYGGNKGTIKGIGFKVF